MSMNQERQLNHAAYRRLRDTINQSYPAGRFVAIAKGQIVADADSFNELDRVLCNMGITSPEVLVVKAGVDYPEMVTIFIEVGYTSICRSSNWTKMWKAMAMMRS